MKRKFSTELAYVCGIVFIALGVMLMEKADFGVSMVVAPVYLFYRWLSPFRHFFRGGRWGEGDRIMLEGVEIYVMYFTIDQARRTGCPHITFLSVFPTEQGPGNVICGSGIMTGCISAEISDMGLMRHSLRGKTK